MFAKSRTVNRQYIGKNIQNLMELPDLIDIIDIEPNQKILMCTDGLNGYVEDKEILKIVNEYGDSSAEKLVETANNAGGRDNVTVVILTQGE